MNTTITETSILNMEQKLKLERPKLNWHFLTKCNFSCRYCFVDKTLRLKREAYLFALERLAPYFSEINFVGGEPTADKELLLALMRRARQLGLKCSIVTNGYNLIHRPDEFDVIFDLCYCIGISIDSLKPATNHAIGRHYQGHVITREEYVALCKKIKSRGCMLKINTVVSVLNKDEDMSDFYCEVNPDRIKLFQVKPSVRKHYDDMLISDEQYRVFVERHQKFCNKEMVCEDNEDMTNAYYMLNGECQFFSDCIHGDNCKSPSIADPATDMAEAMSYIKIDSEKYNRRYSA